MTKTERVASGTVHRIPSDWKQTLLSHPKELAAWQSFTPLARNEWICWVISVKKAETRQKHLTVGLDKIRKGMRRPCCWAGCTHRSKRAAP